MSTFNVYSSNSAYAGSYTAPNGVHAALAQAQYSDLTSPTGYSQTSEASRAASHAAIVANVAFKDSGVSLA